jgi:alcohol dehydrogenase class IV
MDALCQLMESYTSTGAQPMTDALALRGIRIAARALQRAYENPTDLDAREQMALAALLSGITLANAGLGAVHGFAAPLGALHPIPHGAICAALLPPVIGANVRALRAQSPTHPTLARYGEMGRISAGNNALDEAHAIEACEHFTADLVTALRIPRLSRFGFAEAHIQEAVPLARKSSSMRFNPVVLSDAALEEILRQAM